MCDYIKTILIKDVVIEGSKLNKNINDTILRILKNNIEDKCLDKGFVKKDSVNIIKRSAGIFSGSLFNGSVKFNVVFSCELCHPNKGDILKCKVLRVNELGVRGLVGPIKVTVAKQFQDNKSIFKDIKEGDMIEVVVLDKKFDLNNKFIQVAAKIDEDKLFKKMQKIEENKKSKKNKTANKIVLSSLESLESFTNNNVNINDIAEELEISDSDELDEFYGTNKVELDEEKVENNENVLSYENITGKDNVNLQTTNININADNPNKQEEIASEESEEEELEESDEDEETDAESEEETNVESEDESFDMEKDEDSDLDEIQYSANNEEEIEKSTDDEEINY
jgi:DNA-directed RNA polymerase subunit E'/Rpb7